MTLPLGASYLFKSALVFAAILTIAYTAWRRHRRPSAAFGAANIVTTVRVLLTAMTAGLIGEPTVPAVAVTGITIASAATVLDGVDGWIARKTATTSAFGARYDMETDALLVLVLSVLVWRGGKAGAWVLLAGLWRYLFVAAGQFLPGMRRPLSPTFRAKAACVVQIAGLLLALVPTVTPPASTAVAAASLAVLSYSFIVDIIRLWQMP